MLVLGDARNNYNDPRAWCLRDIHTKAKNVVWLNPESPSAWGFGDSVMDKYLPYMRRRRGVPQPAPALEDRRPARALTTAVSAARRQIEGAPKANAPPACAERGVTGRRAVDR